TFSALRRNWDQRNFDQLVASRIRACRWRFVDIELTAQDRPELPDTRPDRNCSQRLHKSLFAAQWVLHTVRPRLHGSQCPGLDGTSNNFLPSRTARDLPNKRSRPSAK